MGGPCYTSLEIRKPLTICEKGAMPWLNTGVMIVGSQACSRGDLLAAPTCAGWLHLATFLTWWFVIYFGLRTVAMFANYVLASVPSASRWAFRRNFHRNGERAWCASSRRSARRACYAGVSLAVLAFVVMAL